MDFCFHSRVSWTLPFQTQLPENLLIRWFNLLFIGKSSHQCRSDGSITADYGAQSTQSLGHKGAPLTGLKPQTNKVGTLPRRRDTSADGKGFFFFSILAQCSTKLHPTWAASNATNHFHPSPNDFIYHPLHSPHASLEVPAQCGTPHEQLVGSCSLGLLWGVHGDRLDARAPAYGFLERHSINI